MTNLSAYRQAVREVGCMRRIGYVTQVSGLAIESAGPAVAVGDMCAIGGKQPGSSRPPLLAEVVSVRPGRVTLMPYGQVEGLAVGTEVVARERLSGIGVGSQLLGRVIDGFGLPLDGLPAPVTTHMRPLRAAPSNPMRRPRIDQVLETGVRVIDALLTVGQGQRVGIFAGSGVGKSSLLGAMVRHTAATVRVVAMIGERGREVRDFIDKQLGAAGMKDTVVVVATADQPPLARLRAAYAALAIAEHFRAEGKQVLLTVDSMTRLAMARREVGLAAGEPPTVRGYTPSVFAELPEFCERCGTADSGGAITAFFTVLVDGDDFNEPVSDSLRAILDGHIVLSRQIAHRGQYPAIDVLRSASRLLPELASVGQQALARSAVAVIELLERNRQLIDIGAYQRGSNPDIDRALAIEPALLEWLRQADGGTPRAQALGALAGILDPGKQT